MALWQGSSPLRRLADHLRPTPTKPAGRELRRLKEKHDSLSRATEEWLTLLREMERNGESGGAQYERYYQAYQQAKHQQKVVDLELFNHRQGLTT